MLQLIPSLQHCSFAVQALPSQIRAKLMIFHLILTYVGIPHHFTELAICLGMQKRKGKEKELRKRCYPRSENTRSLQFCANLRKWCLMSA
ncbi:hypothetical protein Y032_0003g1587 [Ancylostoma ceylanicum]|uniref:Uncharacterized protein n=1 Tax=Ancylostoma ceylanicum TaxID=53326 RepID=A0A016VYH4_9BILA|nr:hypothetical protein Y032_0003g1587 [Ancylostoma ceylanicum]